MSNEFDDIRNAKSEWLEGPYMGKCKVIAAVRSETEKAKDGSPYKGRPYYKVVLECVNGSKHNHFIWRAQAGDDAEKRQKMAASARREFVRFGIDVENEPDLLKALVGKKFLGAFGREEYIGKDKTGRPCMKDGIKLFYINDENTPFGVGVTLGSLNRTLSDQDQQKLVAQQQIFDQSRGVAQGTVTEIPDGLAELPTPPIQTAAQTQPPTMNGPEAFEGPDDLPY